MTLKEKVYWQDTTKMPSDESPEGLPSRVDIAVVGGGIPGLAAARTLARRGVSVAMLEAENMGWGASSRNGGMALTGLKLDAEVVEARYGVELTRKLFDDSVVSLDTVQQLITQEHIECDFNRCGHLLLANKPAHYTALQNEADWFIQHFNHITRLIPKNKLHAEIGSDIYFGGLMDESSAGLNPAQYVVGLVQAAKRSGVYLCPKARVTHIEKTVEGFSLETVRGSMLASQVLVTTGGYTGTATPQLRRRIIPIGSYIIATQPLPEDLAHELIPQRRMVFDYKHYLNYFRLSADNRMVFGGRAAFFPETSSTIRRSAEILRRQMVKVYPKMNDVIVEYAWGGTLDFAFDQMPHTGQLGGIYYVLGFAGHGVALGTHLGILMANAILDDTVKDLPYSAYAFNSLPLGLYNGRPWFLPLIGLWHRILDWIY